MGNVPDLFDALLSAAAARPGSCRRCRRNRSTELHVGGSNLVAGTAAASALRWSCIPESSVLFRELVIRCRLLESLVGLDGVLHISQEVVVEVRVNLQIRKWRRARRDVSVDDRVDVLDRRCG